MWKTGASECQAKWTRIRHFWTIISGFHCILRKTTLENCYQIGTSASRTKPFFLWPNHTSPSKNKFWMTFVLSSQFLTFCYYRLIWKVFKIAQKVLYRNSNAISRVIDPFWNVYWKGGLTAAVTAISTEAVLLLMGSQWDKDYSFCCSPIIIW